jgi:hypothetical protein
VQVPAETKVTVLPETVQTDAVADVNTTGFPELPPVALIETVPVPKV